MKMGEEEVKHPAILLPDLAAIVIQRAIRGKLARRKRAILVAENYQPVFDRVFLQFFYFNERTGKSAWTRPKRTVLFQDPRSVAAIRIQSAARNKLIALLKSKVRAQKKAFARRRPKTVSNSPTPSKPRTDPLSVSTG
jgi:hypothetical protein